MEAKRRVKKDDADEVEEEEKPKRSSKTGKAAAPKKEGYNWSAIAIMLMFGLPLCITIGVQALDFFYPKAALERGIKNKVIRCYTVANPSKLGEVDRLVKKYAGKEQILFAQLRDKYEKYPECN